MHSSKWRAVNTGFYPLVGSPHHLANLRGNLTRCIHLSQPLLRADRPSATPKVADGRNDGSPTPETGLNGSSIEQGSGEPSGSSGSPEKPINKSNYGSASRRAVRNWKKLKDVPPFQLPRPFLNQNVFLKEKNDTNFVDLPLSHRAPDPPNTRTAADTTGSSPRHVAAEKTSDQTMAKKGSPPDFQRVMWRFGHGVLDELQSAVSTGLQIPASRHSNEASFARPHLILYNPKKGSNMFLDDLVMCLAGRGGIDLVQIDAHDLAEMGGDYLDESSDPANEPLSSLSYEVYVANQGNKVQSNANTNAATTNEDPLAELVELLKAKLMSKPQQQPGRQSYKVTGPTAEESSRDQKLALFLDSLFHACDIKRALQSTDHEGPPKTNPNRNSFKSENADAEFAVQQDATPTSSPTLIIHIKDYPEICNTQSGGKLLDALHSALSERRAAGERILLIGTCVSGNADLASSRLENDTLSEDLDPGGLTRTILVPLSSDRGLEELFAALYKERVKSINIRHLQNMIRRLASTPEKVMKVLSRSGLQVDHRLQIQHDIWSFAAVHRLATTALGLMHEDNKDMDVSHIERAIKVIDASDGTKLRWLSNEKKQARGIRDAEKGRKGKTQTTDSRPDKKQLEKECNQHERRLLNGMIDPSDIRVTFAQAHAPKETVQTLKDLTLLPLSCPEEFDYGVLAEQSISGLLLYGPPGTGKTLLAKAVAKEGGATILEVSGADLSSKWVGESEKNVRALFSLARKLKPCIVFLDEADAILGARGNNHSRSGHRDLINQFLREWDGLKEATAFIMVATNRPFDLDDAVVRRLPKRILIDLPTEEDREEILKILLKNEVLDPEVSLAKLAADTPLYSGSDLKHLIVTAAQACVRENYDAAHASPELEPASSKTTSPSPLILPAPAPSPTISPAISSMSPAPSLAATSQQPSSPSSSTPTARESSNSSWHNALPQMMRAFIPSTPFKSKEPSPPSPPPNSISSPTPSLSSTTTHTATVSTPAPSTSQSSSSTPPSSAPTSPSPPITPPKSDTNSTSTPTKRILRSHHFSRALEEISASVSEDMGSLRAIKKFDERYGDRRGRKKGKLEGGFGFETLGEKEREEVREKGGRVRGVV
ncbi:MAG: hypothetical protein Q9219_003602 [cf. Caloplaca sp. 3 TL-2023]